MFFNPIRRYKFGSRRKVSLVPILVLAVSLIMVGFGGWLWWQNSHNPIPASFQQKINFPIFYPGSQSPAIVNKSSFKYDSNNSLFSFVVTDAGQSLIITEQATPQAFIDVPQAYATLINSLNNYYSFDSLQGQVDLTYPKEFNGQQSAVMNAKGTLMFAHDTARGLSNTQWQHFFNDLTIVQ
jgi:hypothetical protein